MVNDAGKKGVATWLALLAIGLAMWFVNACRQSDVHPTVVRSHAENTKPIPGHRERRSSHTQPVPPGAGHRETLDNHQTGRWLYVERFEPGTTGGFVEGDFSAERNRLSIKTREITRFAVDTRYVDLDWNRLVVIRINGQNSELKRRDDPVLHFVLNRFNQWVVED